MRGVVVAKPAMLLAACGGAAEPAEPAPTVGPATAGGHATAPAEPEEPVVMRTTTPVPAVPREERTEPLQLPWERTERVVEVRPPEPPSDGTMEAVTAWAEGPFVDWMRARREAIRVAENDVGFLAEATLPERAVAAPLFGYMDEDTAAGMRGAPVPEEVAGDPELLDAYVAALDEALLPYARSAAEAFATCAATLAQHGDPEWGEWVACCADRGRELVEVYEIEIETDGTTATDAGEDAGAAEPPDPS